MRTQKNKNFFNWCVGLCNAHEQIGLEMCETQVQVINLVASLAFAIKIC